VTLSLRRTSLADQDIDDIWLHIALDSVAAADAFVDRLEAAEKRLSELPYLGQATPDLHPCLRHWVVGRYLILYRVDPDALVIVRVMHGARDLPNVLDP
jgi:toxin ParE1/3/4